MKKENCYLQNRQQSTRKTARCATTPMVVLYNKVHYIHELKNLYKSHAVRKRVIEWENIISKYDDNPSYLYTLWDIPQCWDAEEKENIVVLPNTDIMVPTHKEAVISYAFIDGNRIKFIS